MTQHSPMMNASAVRIPVTFQRELHSRIAEFDDLAQALTAWGVAAGVPQRTMSQVVLILDELFANVVMHGYQHDAAGEVLVQAHIADGAVHITLTDHAPPFDPLQVPEPDTTLALEDREIGGLGLLFVRRTADALDYRLLNAGTPQTANELRFAKHYVQPTA